MVSYLCISGLDSLFSYIDAHAMDRILSESVDRLNFHWDSCMAMLDRVKLPSRRRRLSEADVGEPLSTFFEFGQLRLQSQPIVHICGIVCHMMIVFMII